MLGQTTAGQLLATAWNDRTVQLHREQQAYLEGNNFDLPLLRKLEVRIESRDFDPKQREFALRMNTNGFGMNHAQSAIYGSMKELTETERQMLVQEALLDRYELLLEVHFEGQTLALLERQRQVLLDKKAVYSQQLALGLEQDLDDFFRTEDDLLQLEQKVFEVKNVGSAVLLRMKIFTGEADSLAMFALLSLAEIKLVADNISQGNATAPPAVLRRQVQTDMALHQEKMEKMEGRHLLNYLQFRYSGNANDLLEDRFSIGAGFDLPWPNGSKLRQQELHLETLEAKAQAEATRQAFEEAVALKNNQLLQDFERYDFLKNQLETSKNRYSPKQLFASGLENPETLLRVQESLARLELELATAEKDIYQSYLSLLGVTGLLTQEPARNYLSAGLELIAR